MRHPYAINPAALARTRRLARRRAMRFNAPAFYAGATLAALGVALLAVASPAAPAHASALCIMAMGALLVLLGVMANAGEIRAHSAATRQRASRALVRSGAYAAQCQRLRWARY